MAIRLVSKGWINRTFQVAWDLFQFVVLQKCKSLQLLEVSKTCTVQKPKSFSSFPLSNQAEIKITYSAEKFSKNKKAQHYSLQQSHVSSLAQVRWTWFHILTQPSVTAVITKALSKAADPDRRGRSQEPRSGSEFLTSARVPQVLGGVIETILFILLYYSYILSFSSLRDCLPGYWPFITSHLC